MNDKPIPFELFEKEHQWPTKVALQRYRHQAKKLGIEKAFIKFGGRVLIKPKTFFELIEAQQETK